MAHQEGSPSRRSELPDGENPNGPPDAVVGDDTEGEELILGRVGDTDVDGDGLILGRVGDTDVDGDGLNLGRVGDTDVDGDGLNLGRVGDTAGDGDGLNLGRVGDTAGDGDGFILGRVGDTAGDGDGLNLGRVGDTDVESVSLIRGDGLNVAVIDFSEGPAIGADPDEPAPTDDEAQDYTGAEVERNERDPDEPPEDMAEDSDEPPPDDASVSENNGNALEDYGAE